MDPNGWLCFAFFCVWMAYSAIEVIWGKRDS
jgi:hypothetical protein